MAATPDKNTPPADATGAGTTDTTAAPVVDTAADSAKDAQIAALQAQLAAVQAQAALGQLTASQVAPATFSAPSAPLVTKYNKVTGLANQMPQKLWDQLVDEDKANFTDYVDQAPAALPTNGQ